MLPVIVDGALVWRELSDRALWWVKMSSCWQSRVWASREELGEQQNQGGFPQKCTILEDFDFKYFGFLSHIKMKQKLPQNCYKKDTLGVEIMELLTTYPLVI